METTKKIRRLTKNRKGIDTILAALLMVVIVVVASVMVYAWSTGLLGSLLVKPTVGQEVLNMDTYTFNTANNVSLYLRNSGSISVSFSAYYVKDLSSGNQYSKSSGWTGGPINPQASLRVDITTDNTVTFTTGSWDITLVTARGNQFVYRVTK